MDVTMEGIIQSLTAAVELMMNPHTPHQQRLEAYQACEEFKDTSPHCAQAGLLMSGREHPPIIRHFGLQLLENCVRERWYKLTIEERQFIKENAMKLMSRGTADILTEEIHIKDALSRIVVEVMKREWPTQWPTLLDELDALCRQGAVQTELVLLIFLRLAEDIVSFDTLPSARRREMQQSLNAVMSDVFTFFITTLKEHAGKYQALKETDQTQAMVHCRVAQAVLLSLSGYLEWVGISHIVIHNNVLLEMLCFLLDDDQLQLKVAECLLMITSRKGILDERKPLLLLFHEAALSTILSVAVSAANVYTDPGKYLVLKKLGQVMASLGSQLCALWGPTDVTQPANFEMYLEAIAAFTHHPSKTLSKVNQTLWSSFIRHEHISKDPIFLQVIPRLAEGARNTLLKVGFPSQDNSDSCQYSRLDFDSDEEFTTFYTKYRAETSEMLRSLTKLIPCVTFEVASNWLTEVLQKPVGIEGEDMELCNLSSPAYLEWEALTVYLNCVMSRIFSITDKPKPPDEAGVPLLKAVLNYDSKDPLIQSSLLSCISYLFQYVMYSPDTLPIVLDKIFASAVFTLQGQTKSGRSKSVQAVRRHACSVMIRICKDYPQLLLPGFDQLYSHIKKLCQDPDELSQLEKVTLMEAFTLISNEMKDFQKQTLFLEEILAPIKEIWLSDEMKVAVSSPENFMTYIGLDQPAVEPSSADICGINRSKVINCTQAFLGLIRRCKCPNNLEEAKAGGFAVPTADGTIILRNPVMPHITAALDNVVHLIRTFNALELPDMTKRLHPDFAKAFDLMEIDRLLLFGIQPPVADNSNRVSSKQPLDRVQHFLNILNGSCYHMLKSAAECLAHEFYTIPNLVPALANSVFFNMNYISAFRLRHIIKVFVRPFIQHCPKDMYSSIVIPILSIMAPSMYQRLIGEWQIVTSRSENSVEGEEENPESREVMDDQLIRLLTREYIDMLGNICQPHQGRPVAGPQDGEEDMAMEEENGMATSQNIQDDASLSELGMLITKNEALCPSVLWCVFTCLTWSDSMIIHRCSELTPVLLKPLVEERKLSSEDACNLMSCMLVGLQQHGQHDHIQSYLISYTLQVYELLRPAYPDIITVLLLVPSCTEDALKSFDEKVFSKSNLKPYQEKKKRVIFRKLLREAIGKNVGQKFSKDILIKKLTSLPKKPKILPSVIDADEKDLGLCSLFTPDPDQGNAL